MKYLIIRKHGKNKTIEARDLDEAEAKADKKYPGWIDSRVKGGDFACV